MEGLVQRRPLKDKLRQHWDSREEIWAPKPEKANKMGRTFTWVYTCSLLYTTVCVMLPEISTTAELSNLFWWQTLMVYFFLNVIFNWLLTADLTFSKATSEHVPQVSGDINKNALPRDWKDCPVCQINVPPRAHHCKVCNVCILKREHHCFFTGRCIGWANQRRFVPFLFHTLCGTIYSIIITSVYLTGSRLPWSRVWYNYLPGVSLIQWIVRDLPTGHFFLLLQLYIACIIMFAAGAFLVWQFTVIFRGQTTYELIRGIETYRTSMVDGFRATFGSYGILHFIAPMTFHLDNDGVNWPLYKSYKTS